MIFIKICSLSLSLSLDDWKRAQEKLLEAEETSDIIDSEGLSESDYLSALKERRRKRKKKNHDTEPPIKNKKIIENRRDKKKTECTINDGMLPKPPEPEQLYYSSTSESTQLSLSAKMKSKENRCPNIAKEYEGI